MMYFANVSTIIDLKKTYRKLATMNHPDNGGNTVTMAEINAEYTTIFEKLKNENNKKAETDKNTKTINECPKEFIFIISELLKIKNIQIELCGHWIWIEGDTKPAKDRLKSIGCRWATKKQKWYWRNDKDASPSRGSKSMDYIREKYGSEKFTSLKYDEISA